MCLSVGQEETCKEDMDGYGVSRAWKEVRCTEKV